MQCGAMPAVEPAQILRSHDLRPQFQPIVDLAGEEVVGFEALARGPVGTAGEMADELIAAALIAIAAADVDSRYRFFLNAEYCTDLERLRTELTVLEDRAPGAQIVLELTERAAGQGAGSLAAGAEVARSHGWPVALDVARDHSGLGLLTTVRPDFIKLDLGAVQRGAVSVIVPLLVAVADYVDQSGAILIAGGIDSAKHLRTARSVGVVWGQGLAFGRPGPLPATAVKHAGLRYKNISEHKRETRKDP